MTPRRSKVAAFVLDNSLLLLVGTAAAVVWANLDVASYETVAHPLHFGSTTSGWCSSSRSQPRRFSRRRCREGRWRLRVVRFPRSPRRLAGWLRPR